MNLVTLEPYSAEEWDFLCAHFRETPLAEAQLSQLATSVGYRWPIADKKEIVDRYLDFKYEDLSSAPGLVRRPKRVQLLVDILRQTLSFEMPMDEYTDQIRDMPRTQVDSMIFEQQAIPEGPRIPNLQEPVDVPRTTTTDPVSSTAFEFSAGSRKAADQFLKRFARVEELEGFRDLLSYRFALKSEEPADTEVEPFVSILPELNVLLQLVAQLELDVLKQADDNEPSRFVECLLDRLPVAVIAVDRTGRIISRNANCAEYPFLQSDSYGGIEVFERVDVDAAQTTGVEFLFQDCLYFAKRFVHSGQVDASLQVLAFYNFLPLRMRLEELCWAEYGKSLNFCRRSTVVAVNFGEGELIDNSAEEIHFSSPCYSVDSRVRVHPLNRHQYFAFFGDLSPAECRQYLREHCLRLGLEAAQIALADLSRQAVQLNGPDAWRLSMREQLQDVGYALRPKVLIASAFRPLVASLKKTLAPVADVNSAESIARAERRLNLGETDALVIDIDTFMGPFSSGLESSR